MVQPLPKNRNRHARHQRGQIVDGAPHALSLHPLIQENGYRQGNDGAARHSGDDVVESVEECLANQRVGEHGFPPL